MRGGGILGLAALVAACAVGAQEAAIAPQPTLEAGARRAQATPSPSLESSAPAPGASFDLAAASGEAEPSLAAFLSRLRAASCPQGVDLRQASSIPLTATPVSLQAFNPSRRRVGALDFVAGYHLTSSDARFGGLSGLDFIADDRLLAISDEGEFVWIDLARDGVTPVAARIAPMLDESGAALSGKSQGDAEGLAVKDGLAFVSFERDHRVLAFDLAACGAAARGAPAAGSSSVSSAFYRAGLSVGENEGPEPLGVTSDWRLFVGLETKAGGESPLSARPIEAPAEFDLRLGEGAPEFVGLDLADGKEGLKDVLAFTLHRSFSPLTGNAIAINETRFERYLDEAGPPAGEEGAEERSRHRFRKTSERTLATLNILFTIDNFEGLAVKELPDGRMRLFVISDNNFSSRQRTLLMAFDVETQ